jgi:DNA-binding GntR family transcriptional regulator
MGEQIFDSLVASGLKSGTVVRNSVGDIVYQAMLESIHSGRLAQGQKINDLELAEQLGVSRTPVREAIQRLKEIGIVESAPNRYTRITTVDSRAFRDALRVWEALYVVLLNEVTPLVKSVVVKTLRRDHERFHAALSREDSVGAAGATYDFFDRLRQLTTNMYLSRGLESVVHVVRLGSISLTESIDTVALSDAQREFIDALDKNDRDRAAMALRSSVSSGLQGRASLS